jgi:hypothetical protein
MQIPEQHMPGPAMMQVPMMMVPMPMASTTPSYPNPTALIQSTSPLRRGFSQQQQLQQQQQQQQGHRMWFY